MTAWCVARLRLHVAELKGAIQHTGRVCNFSLLSWVSHLHGVESLGGEKMGKYIQVPACLGDWETWSRS